MAVCRVTATKFYKISVGAEALVLIVVCVFYNAKKPVLEIVEQLSQGSRNCWCVYGFAVFLFSWWDDFGCHGWEPAKKEMISVKWVWIILFEITTGRKNKLRYLLTFVHQFMIMNNPMFSKYFRKSLLRKTLKSWICYREQRRLEQHQKLKADVAVRRNVLPRYSEIIFVLELLLWLVIRVKKLFVPHVGDGNTGFTGSTKC